MKLWGGRFDKNTDQALEDFGASIHFDQVLWREDIRGTLAHIEGLYKSAVLSQEEFNQLSQGLKKIAHKLETGEAIFSVEDEDIHMNIERMLFNELGDIAGKVHTGRSRNDQVALDMRLYMRQQLQNLIENCRQLQQSLLEKAEDNIDTLFPGYTHLQRAQPIRFAHHWLAYNWMFLRDIKRLQQAYATTNVMPLGAGALSGSSFNVDQKELANQLHFEAVYLNSIDAVSDRDYLVEFLSASSLIMMHLSKLCEELILWSSQEFAFIEIDDAYCTGSSMMPQKKNPDAAELIRGKTGRVYGALIGMLTMLKGLPLAYNKDLQEDKESVFDTLNTVNNCITVMAKMIATLKINPNLNQDRLADGFLNATEFANYLVRKGMTFRQAHEVVGKLVKHCLNHSVTLSHLTLKELQNFSNYFQDDALELLAFENIVEKQNNLCGTAKASVLNQIKTVKQALQDVQEWLSECP